MIVLVIEVRGCHDRLHSNGAPAITSAEIQLEDLSRGQRAAPHSKAKPDKFQHIHTPGGAITGPCLTDAAPKAAPGELFVEEPLRGGPNINLSDRCGSLHRWVHVHISTARDGTLGIGIRANTKVVPMMRLVKIICSLFDARRRRGGAF